MVGEAGRAFGDAAKAQRLVVAAGPHQDDGGPVAVDMAVDALVRDVHPLPVAVEERPQPFARAVRLCVPIAGEVGQFHRPGLPVGRSVGETLRASR